jgi:hypothetical protein
LIQFDENFFFKAKKYNALGALQFSRDLGALSQSLMAVNAHSRSDVARLNQMCIVLSLEKCSDIEGSKLQSSFCG